jgi:hypothetical protein
MAVSQDREKEEELTPNPMQPLVSVPRNVISAKPEVLSTLRCRSRVARDVVLVLEEKMVSYMFSCRSVTGIS